MKLAELCGTSTSYIGEIEIGKKFPSIEMIEQILKDLEIIPIDMVSENIRDVINKINELTGENVKEEVLNEIFKNFCLGK